MLNNDLLNFTLYYEMKSKGLTPQDAVHEARQQNLNEFLIVKMLREVFELSFENASRMASNNKPQ